MKHTGKKILSMLLCVALLLSAAACGSSSAQASALGADQIEADVQEYIRGYPKLCVRRVPAGPR